MMGMGGMGAPLPPMGGMPEPDADNMGMAGGAAPSMSPVEAVLAALQVMQAERQTEDDVVLQAVMAATGGMPSGLGGVTEGAPMGVPMGDPMGLPGAAPEMGAY